MPSEDFTANGTFTAKAGITSYTVIAIGRGKDGAPSTAGGGGGAYSSKAVTLVPLSNYDVAIGAVESAFDCPAGIPGTQACKAEAGGQVNVYDGGRSANGLGDVKFSGGAGAQDAGGDAGGGGAGNAGGVGGNGSAAPGIGGTSASPGGAGGNTGANGSNYGGGGGSALLAPGTGASGLVRVSWVLPSLKYDCRCPAILHYVMFRMFSLSRALFTDKARDRAKEVSRRAGLGKGGTKLPPRRQ